MNFLKIRTSRLTNNEHFELNTEVKDVIEKVTPVVLGIEPKYPGYLLSYNNEDKAINVIRNNPFTQKVDEDDASRDEVFAGLRDMIKANLRHFVAEKREAAGRIMRILDHYGNVAVKSYDEETVDIRSMIKEFRGEYAADIALLGLVEWVNELERLNDAFVATIKRRDEYDASKTGLRMVQVRKEVDENLKSLLRTIEVLADLNPSETYSAFFTQVNVILDKYNKKVTVRKGRKSDTVEETPTVL